jgi:hypothetical protein
MNVRRLKVVVNPRGGKRNGHRVLDSPRFSLADASTVYEDIRWLTRRIELRRVSSSRFVFDSIGRRRSNELRW